jgi:hypothetical protein
MPSSNSETAHPPASGSVRPGILVALLVLLASSTSADGQDAAGAEGESSLTVRGQAWVQGLAVDGPTSWREGGFGRLDLGEDAGLARGDLVIDWQPSTSIARSLTFFLHATARAEPDAIRGGRAGGGESGERGSDEVVGVVEAYVEAEWDVRTADRFRLRLGHFILPTSRAQTHLGWSSPYTLGFSALDTWIGEEVRPTGLVASYNLAIGAIDDLEIGASSFWNNDTAGTLLAWRGWALSDRLTTFGEVLPLPDLPELADGGAFGEQRDDGTRAFGADLDGRAGWAGWLRWRRPERFTFQWTRYDNRGDRRIHDGEYAWRTRFDLVGAEFHHRSLSLVSEWMWGSTGMGNRSGSHVDLDFSAYSVLASWAWEYFRFSARWDEFDSRDRDGSLPFDPNDDDGNALTLALLWEPYPRPLRIGLEWTDVEGTRPAAELAGFPIETGGESWKLELRWYFDP